MGTGETTRRLIEAYPDAWVIGLDSSPDMVFRARETYDDVQLARMEDPLPDGPWDLVISVLSVNELTDDQKRNLFRRVKEQARSLVIGDVFEPSAPLIPATLPERCGPGSGAAKVTWQRGRPGRGPRGLLRPPHRRTPRRYHLASDGRPEEENLQRPPRQAPRQAQGRQGAPQQLPALPQPAAAAPGLPDLRHLRRA